MTDNRKISICCTTFNRFEFTIKCFKDILQDERVGECILVDDHSTDGSYEKLCHHYVKEHKVKIYRNDHNLDCFLNKHRAVQLATLDWVALLDSDNIFSTDYIDKLFAIHQWMHFTVYQPAFAKPHFDFREFEGNVINKENINNFIDKKMFLTLLNAQNYFFNKEFYLKAWNGSVDPVTADSLWTNYNMLKHGYSIFVVPGLQYEHVIHNQSHYQLNFSRTGNFALEVENKLRALI